MALTGGAATAACILVLLALAGAAEAASSAPPPVDCSALLAGLADCLDFVSPGSKSSQPSKACCGEVKTSVGSPAVVDCVCAAMFSKQTQLPINKTRVYALPNACGTPASVLNRCHALPGGAPAEAPAPSPSSGSAAASPPKANASARSPATILVATVAASLLAFYYL
ncbi:non-specific lipid transfer protein-like 1 isoform X2 [Hordeum vulgare subsp. vulgare]|uniref:non-specific lipid transfer protein-like 1 isoform X2 n=1 Tax=Hordeum vulgare subsp. vulgare TaxID=112509 RepID=UPI001D1A35D6|nr:non-specific lipid transfer protein-like 1 isoform X2 [Hordeum vulgare subsp. vulgare]